VAEEKRGGQTKWDCEDRLNLRTGKKWSSEGNGTLLVKTNQAGSKSNLWRGKENGGKTDAPTPSREEGATYRNHEHHQWRTAVYSPFRKEKAYRRGVRGQGQTQKDQQVGSPHRT